MFLASGLKLSWRSMLATEERLKSGQVSDRPIEPVAARGTLVTIVGVFRSPEPPPSTSSNGLNGLNASATASLHHPTSNHGSNVTTPHSAPLCAPSTSTAPAPPPPPSLNPAFSIFGSGGLTSEKFANMHRQYTNASGNSDQNEEFTPEELQEFAQAFKMFDKDGNGTINVRELGVAMRTLGQNPTEEELLNIVNVYDVDGNGKIDFKEFCQMMKMMNKESDQELIRLAFKVFDKDGNGYITAQEFKHFMTTMGEKFSEEEVDEIIKEVDKDGDEQIDYEEFVQMVAPIVQDRDREDPFAAVPTPLPTAAATTKNGK